MRPSVLIVDDDPEMRELIETAIASRDYSVGSCPTAEAALELLEANEYDVLISDQHMPGMTGIELCRRTRERRPKVSIIMLTSFGTRELASEALRAGVCDFITKPVSLEVLVSTIDKASREHPEATPPRLTSAEGP